MKSLVSQGVGPAILGYGAIKAEYESGAFVASKLTRPNIQREFILDEATNMRHPKAVAKMKAITIEAIRGMARLQVLE